jgi:hypothetical protein
MTVGPGPRCEAEIFSGSRQIVVEMLGNAVLSIMSSLSTHVHAKSTFHPYPPKARVL